MQSRKRSISAEFDDLSTFLSESNKRLKAENGLPSKNAQHDITTVICDVPHFVSGAYFGRGKPLFSPTVECLTAPCLLTQEDYTLSQVREGLTNEEMPWSFGIYGLGGVGKTQLALKYISAYQHMYTHVLWVVADSEMKLSTAYRKFSMRLELVKKDDEDPTKCRDAFKDWLLHHKTWLLVFDNVEDPTILRDYLPSSYTGAVLTTSRTPAIVENKIVEGGLRLQPLDNDEGTKFLLSRMPNLDPQEYRLATEISKELGGHLLALSTMVAYITESGCSLTEFLQIYRENKNDLMKRTEDLRTATFNYELSFATCWTLSISNLNGDHPGDLLGILALLDPDLDEGILKQFAEHEKPSLIPVLKNLFTYRDAFRKLRNIALIQCAPESKVISTHRLVQDATIRMFEANSTLGTAFDNAVLCLSRVYPRQVNGESMSNDFAACQRLTPHVSALEASFKKYFGLQQTPSDKMPKLRETFAEILANCGWYLYETGEITAALTLFSTAEEICEFYFGDRPHPLTALIYNNVCAVHNAQNRPLQSLDYAMRALKIRELCLDKDDPEMGKSYSNYGHNLFDLGRHEEAQVFYEKALKLHQSSKTPSDDLLEGIYSSCADNLSKMGRLEEAEAAFKKALSYHEALGNGNFYVAVTLFLYGSLKMFQKEWHKAEKLMRQCLTLRLSILGIHHRLVGVTQHHLAFLCARRGNNAEAVSLLRSAVTILRVPAQTQRGLAPRSMLKLAAVLLAKAEESKDRSAMQEALDLQNEAKTICENDPLLAKLPIATEEDWEQLVYVGYRCC